MAKALHEKYIGSAVMKIGLAQTDIIWENKEKNIEKAESIIIEATEKKLDFILFPEMSLTGFSMKIERISEYKEQLNTIKVFKDIANKYSIAVGVGYVQKTDDRALNKYAVIDKNGVVISDYTKIHPFSYGEENMYYRGGKSLEYCNIESSQNITISTFICYDLRFPEIFQIASKKAQLIIVAANWPSSREDHWYTLLKARSIENQCYIAGINRAGEGNGIRYSGASVVFDPYGNQISEDIAGEGLITAEIYRETVDSCREEFRLKADRREALYYYLK